MKHKIWLQIGFFLVLLGAWQILALLELWPPYLFPSPVDIVNSILSSIGDGTLPRAILASLGRILGGYGFSLCIGIPLGLFMGRSEIFRSTFGSIILGLQTLPSICWLPIALLWFGLSESAILFVVVMGASLSITIATSDGVRNTPTLYIKVGQIMGGKSWFLYRHVILPAALPSIVSGMKLGWSFAWRSLMAGELLYVGIGLGQMLNTGRELNDMSIVLAVMLIIVILGLIVDKGIFSPLEKRMRLMYDLGQ